MRKIILLTAMFGAMMVSCAKNEILEIEEGEEVVMPTDAEIVEGIMTESIAAVTDQINNMSEGIGAATEFLTVAIPNNGIKTLIEPIAEQIWDCWSWSGLTFGLSDIHGHFTGAFEMWQYTEAGNLQFAYKGSDGKQDKIEITASEEVTDSPLYDEWPICITMPQTIETTISKADNDLLKTMLETQYVVEDDDTSAVFHIDLASTSVNTSSADVKYKKSSSLLSELSVDYAINDSTGNELFSFKYNYDWILFDNIEITLGSRVRIDAGSLDLSAYLTALVACNGSLKNDQSSENVENIRETIDYLNDLTEVTFYLDDYEEGDITLALLQDNGIYQVDAVMTYIEDGSRYQIPGLISSFSDIYDKIDTVIDISKRIIEYIIDYVEENYSEEQTKTTNS